MAARKYYFDETERFDQAFGKDIIAVDGQISSSLEEDEIWVGLGNQLLSVVITGTHRTNLVGVGGMCVAMYFSDFVSDGDDGISDDDTLAVAYMLQGPITNEDYEDATNQASTIIDSASKDDLYITFKTFKKKYFTE